MTQRQFKCPECGVTEISEMAFVETEFSENEDIWNSVLQRQRCAKCGFVIPAHLAELWDGISYEQAVKEWREQYRSTAPKDVAD